MSFPPWASTGNMRKKYGAAIALGASELILSDENSTDVFMEIKTKSPPPAPGNISPISSISLCYSTSHAFISVFYFAYDKYHLMLLILWLLF